MKTDCQQTFKSTTQLKFDLNSYAISVTTRNFVLIRNIKRHVLL